MDEQRQYAYRMILYVATVHLRNSLSVPAHTFPRLWSLRYWREERRRALEAYEVINWLHNLAHFAAFDFSGFKEERLWSDHDRLREKYPNRGFPNFRRAFDAYVSGNEVGTVGY